MKLCRFEIGGPGDGAFTEARIFRSQQIRYLIVGIWNTAFTIGFFSISWLLLGDRVGYGWVLLLCQIVSVVQAHWAQRRWVWLSDRPFWPELRKFALVYVLLFLANLALLAAGVDVLGWDVLPTQIATTVLLVVVGFLVNRHWTFA